MRRFVVNLETQILFTKWGNCVVFGNSTGKIGKVVINGVKQGGVDVA